ncbi:MAG TPA: formyltransferase family protein [Longimicrobium sp.]|nr:formyltransferase family protein [Longimicrobium sp.]
MPRVVLITNDNTHGQRVLQMVWQRGIMLDAVLMLSGTLGVPELRGAGLGKRLLRWPRTFAGTLRRRYRFHRKRKPGYAQRCTRVIVTGAMNGRRLVSQLRALQPDWIVLGGGGILEPQVIETARIGVLNAHPALLPWTRGVGTTGPALEHGVALGATLHYVDGGIDTGAVIERRLVAVAEDETRLAALDLACWELAAEMMADAVEGIVRRGEVPRGVPQAARYPLFRWPSQDDLRRHAEVAASGRAWALYDLWRPLCVDPERNLLPSYDFEAPPSLTLEPVASRAG